MAQWRLLRKVNRGGRHIEMGLPCQDNAAVKDLGWAKILVVADGHGNRRHYRSEIGSQTACEAAVDQISLMLESIRRWDAPTDAELNCLKKCIVSDWRERIEQYALNHPLTAEEQTEADKHPNDWVHVAYGTTLLAAVVTETGWFGIQLGDGMMVSVGADGAYEWLMPQSSINDGNKTASLCMRDPLSDFRHVIVPGLPAGLILCSDGVEKAFPVEGDKVISFLHWLVQAGHQPDKDAADELIGRAANSTANQSSVRDDVSIAMVLDLDQEPTAPKLTRRQQMQRHQQQLAQAIELQAVIDYILRQMRTAQDEQEWASMRSKLLSKLDELNRFAALLTEEETESLPGIRNYESLSSMTYPPTPNDETPYELPSEIQEEWDSPVPPDKPAEPQEEQAPYLNSDDSSAPDDSINESLEPDAATDRLHAAELFLQSMDEPDDDVSDESDAPTESLDGSDPIAELSEADERLSLYSKAESDKDSIGARLLRRIFRDRKA